MPRLETSPSGYRSTLSSFFSRSTDQPRSEIAKAILLQSVRISQRRRGGIDDEERLSGIQGGTLPLRIRPAFVFAAVICLLGLAVLGFHPRGQTYIPINDKVLHFICFLFATGLFYFIWDVDEPARRVWIWRHFALVLTWLVCFAAGGIGSEVVQSLLPYKEFQWGDVVANFMGSGIGLFFSYHAERRYRSKREIQRLYEPLDQELYGDETEEEEEREDEETGGGVNIWKSDSTDHPSHGEGKKVRFGGDTALQGSQSDGHSQLKDNLFRIDDDEDD
ncbi:hypothetical protein CBS101457_002196 [Exobasidium rhododendri]|nr:hypothetical protein CBS101457_002196 [Exobasidium rhododendri]